MRHLKFEHGILKSKQNDKEVPYELIPIKTISNKLAKPKCNVCGKCFESSKILECHVENVHKGILMGDDHNLLCEEGIPNVIQSVNKGILIHKDSEETIFDVHSNGCHICRRTWAQSQRVDVAS